MSVHRKLLFTLPLERLEVDVRLERQEAHDGSLDTNLEPIDGAYNRLSITMGSWTRRGPRSPWREACFGQAIDNVEAFARAMPDKCEALQRLCTLWREWHLNDLQAGTEAQSAAVKEAKLAGEVGTLDYYGDACKALEARGLLTDREYRYGTKWLTRRLPQAVQQEIVSLCERLSD